MDIDDFKHTNDTFGHYIGDLLLQAFSKKVTQVLKQLKLTQDQVDFCRLSGDEFVIVGADITQSTAELIAQTLLESLQQALALDRHQIKVNISIGIALDTLDSIDIKSLFTLADSAMYFAKRRGKNQAKTYDEEVIAEQSNNEDIAKVLKEAISQSAFSLRFLPIFDTQTKKVASVEVLLQTEHPGLQSLPLDKYLSIAEQNGVIKDIDAWMLETSIQALAKHKGLVSQLNLKFYIRISLFDIHNNEFITWLSTLLESHAIPADWLVLVIKEAPQNAESDDSMGNKLQQIQNLGIKLALSHFGTGRTALKHLLYYPIEHIKIDKSFVNDIGDKQHDASKVVSAIM